MNSSFLGAQDIFNAYNKHGEQFLIIDLSTIKENSMKTVKYCQLKIKKENGMEVVPIIKFFNITSAHKVKMPVERDYEQLKLALRRDDESDNTSFGKAMELICNTFSKKVKEMQNNGTISDDINNDDNKKDTVMVPCCRAQTPFQKKAKNKEGESVTLDNPMIWLGLNYKKYQQNELDALETLDYKYNDGKNFKVKDFDLSIYDLEKIVNKKPQIALDAENKKIDNLNIHKFITMNSLMSGTVYMQVVMSKQSFNLNTRITKNLYVKSNKNTSNNSHIFDDDEFATMIAGSAKLVNNSDDSETTTSNVEKAKSDTNNTTNNTNDDSDEEKEEGDYDTDTEDSIKNLKISI